MKTSDISPNENVSIHRRCVREAIHQATDLYVGFTPEWHKAVNEIAHRKFIEITQPPKSKCSKCGK